MIARTYTKYLTDPMDNAYQELEACSATVPYPAGY